MFLHLDLMHLAFNMVALYSVGALLEQVLGKANFVLLYFIGGITGNAVSYLVGMADGGMTVSAGASTSVFGLFVATALLGVLHREGREFFAEYSKGMWGVIAANVAYSFLVPGVSISGHLGGALGGAIAMLMVPSPDCACPMPCALWWRLPGWRFWYGCWRVTGWFSDRLSRARRAVCQVVREACGMMRAAHIKNGAQNNAGGDS